MMKVDLESVTELNYSSLLDMAVSGRGCSTKHQMFSTSCENHVMGGAGEEKWVGVHEIKT